MKFLGRFSKHFTFPNFTLHEKHEKIMVVAVAVWYVEERVPTHQDSPLTLCIVFRSLELQPGQEQSVIPPSDLRITNVALGDELADQNARSSVKLTYRAPSQRDEDDEDEEEDEEDEEDDAEPVTTVLCSLKIGRAHV